MTLCTDPTFSPKGGLLFRRSQEICLPSFCPRPQHPKEVLWPKLDICRALKTFLVRTESIHKSEALFINVLQPKLGQKMSISQSLKLCIREAYRAQKKEVPQDITAHSIRSASTNSALISQTPDGIVRLPCDLSTFIKHYRLNLYKLVEAVFGRKVLEHTMTEDVHDPPD